MAVTLPIITEFDGKGLNRAIAEFKKLETTSEKAAFALKKSFLPAAAAVAGLGVALTQATKAAIEDQAAQRQLALTLRNVTKASDDQIKSVEDHISAMTMATGIADDQLRPAFEALTRGTKNISVSMRDLTLVTDIATATGKPLVEVSDALAKAYQGNYRGLQQLTPEMKALIKDGADMDTIMKTLQGTFGGATDTFANTAQGGFARMTVAINETKEAIGAALLPIVEQVLPLLNRFAAWASENPKVFLAIAGTIGTFSASIVLLNVGLKAYTTITQLATLASKGFAASQVAALGKIGLIVAAIAGLVIGLRRLQQNTDTVSRGIVTAFDVVGMTIINTAVMIARGVAQILNPVIDVMNQINPFEDIPNIPSPDYVQLPKRTFGRGPAPQGFVGPTLDMIQPQMPAFTAPAISTGGGGGGGGGGGAGAPAAPAFASPAIQSVLPDYFMADPTTQAAMNVTINVDGGLATSAEIGESVVNALRQYNQINGPIPVAIG